MMELCWLLIWVIGGAFASEPQMVGKLSNVAFWSLESRLNGHQKWHDAVSAVQIWICIHGIHGIHASPVQWESTNIHLKITQKCKVVGFWYYGTKRIQNPAYACAPELVLFRKMWYRIRTKTHQGHWGLPYSCCRFVALQASGSLKLKHTNETQISEYKCFIKWIIMYIYMKIHENTWNILNHHGTHGTFLCKVQAEQISSVLKKIVCSLHTLPQMRDEILHFQSMYFQKTPLSLFMLRIDMFILQWKEHFQATTHSSVDSRYLRPIL